MIPKVHAVSLVLAWLTVASAAAQPAPATAAFLPGPPRDTADPEQRLRALATVRETLEAQGVRMLSRVALLERLPVPLRPCARTDCAHRVARAARVQLVAAVAVWAERPSVAVSLVTPEGHVFSGTAPIGEDGAIEPATRAALAAARRRQRLGPGPWLHVRGEPRGAQVLIDGQPVGVLPHRTAITPGRHVIRVRLSGHRPAERVVDVPLRNDGEVTVDVRLAPGVHGTEPAPPSTDRRPRRALGHRLGALALGATGAGLVAGAITALARQGCALEAPRGGCLRGRRLRPVPFGLYLGAGLAAGLGALLWVVLTRPGDADGTELGLGPSGLHLRRRF